MNKYKYDHRKIPKKKIKKIVGLFFVGVGFITITYFFFPLISYHLYLSSAFAGGNIATPLPQRFLLSENTSLSELFSYGISNATSNFKDARNWFPQIRKEMPSLPKVSEYEFSVPSQGIDHMKVSTVDFDLSKHLVQYFSTSQNPVAPGTSVIFGHSTLPQLFNPKNYMAIFAHMHLIKEGDEFVITINGKDYHYKVFSISITDSNDPNIFSQASDNSYLTIITCTPPGTTWKRLVVRASLYGG